MGPGRRRRHRLRPDRGRRARRRVLPGRDARGGAGLLRPQVRRARRPGGLLEQRIARRPRERGAGRDGRAQAGRHGPPRRTWWATSPRSDARLEALTPLAAGTPCREREGGPRGARAGRGAADRARRGGRGARRAGARADPLEGSGDRLRELFEEWKTQQRQNRLDQHTEDDALEALQPRAHDLRPQAPPALRAARRAALAGPRGQGAAGRARPRSSRRRPTGRPPPTPSASS